MDPLFADVSEEAADPVPAPHACTVLRGRVQSSVTALAVLPDGRVAAGHSAGWVSVWRGCDPGGAGVAAPAATWATACRKAVCGLVAVDDRLVVATRSVEVEVVQPNGATVATLRGHGNVVVCAAGAGPGRVLTGDFDGVVHLWDVPTASGLRLFSASRGLRCLALLSPPHTVAFGTMKGRVGVWSEGLTDWAGHASVVSAVVVVSPAVVMSASCDDTAKVWRTTDGGSCAAQLFSGKPAASGTGSAVGAVLCATAVPVDGTVATGHSDGSVRLWRAGKGTCVAHMQRPGAAVASVVSLANGDVVVGTSDGCVVVWPWRRRQRLNLIRFLGRCWAAAAGRVAAAPFPSTTVAGALAVMLSARRFCRVRGVCEVVEPFGASVVQFL